MINSDESGSFWSRVLSWYAVCVDTLRCSQLDRELFLDPTYKQAGSQTQDPNSSINLRTLLIFDLSNSATIPGNGWHSAV